MVIPVSPAAAKVSSCFTLKPCIGFGYAIKSLELPNITGRRYWNYIEIGSSEEIGYGEVPAKFMDTINNACRRGVTIWHNHANIGNYNLNNTIV